MKRNTTTLTIVCLSLFLMLFCGAAYADSQSCLICHNAMSGQATLSNGTVIDLRIDATRYGGSVHSFMECTGCHKKFDENPHVKPQEKVSGQVLQTSKQIGHKAKIDPVAYSACTDCHEDSYKQVLSSVHGINITKKRETDGALCLDCHGSPHYIAKSDNMDSMANQWKVVETCGHCHGKEEVTQKYNLETNVLTSYTESFHGKKHHLGHKGAPTCVSCHGYHDIKSKDDPASPVFATNKRQTCGGCHAGANEKFVAAITHKPVGPIPHIAEKLLIVLTLGVFAFIISHVILEAYSEIRDAIFRKKRGSEEHESGKECA